MGKNIENTGSNSVPSPKPEKRVNPEAIRADKQITKYSIKFRIADWHRCEGLKLTSFGADGRKYNLTYTEDRTLRLIVSDYNLVNRH